MQVLITHAYTRSNKGDAAILSVLLRQVVKAFPKATVKISTFDDPKKNKTFEHSQTISSFLYLIVFQYKNKAIKACYASYIIFVTVLWALVYRYFSWELNTILSTPIRKIIQEFKNSDLIIPIGGGYIRSKPGIADTVNLLLVLHPIEISLLLAKPVILYSQSIGPFYNGLQTFMARLVLNRTRLIMVREDHSLKTLRAIGINQHIVTRTVDAAFLFPGVHHSKSIFQPYRKKLASKTIVGITVRQWLGSQEQHKYEQAFAEFINMMASSNMYIFILIPQVSSKLHHDDDRQVAQRIMHAIKNKQYVINLSGNYSHHQVKAMYQNLDFIIGTRFHSVIFALTSYVPALAIEYEYKTSGIMKDLHLNQWVMPIEAVTAKRLYSKFMNLVQAKTSYKKTLHNYLPSYIQQAQDNVEYLRKAYRSFVTEKSERHQILQSYEN